MKTILQSWMVPIGLTLAAVLARGQAKSTAQEPRTVGEAYPTLCRGILVHARLTSLPKGQLLREGNVVVTAEDLRKEIGSQPAFLHAELEANGIVVLEQLATTKVLEDLAGRDKIAAAQVGKDSRDRIDAYLDGQLGEIEVADADIREFYKKNAATFGRAALPQVREYVRQFVRQAKKSNAIDAFLRDLGKKVRIEVSEPWVRKQAVTALDNPLDRARDKDKPVLAIFSGAACCGPDRMEGVVEEVRAQVGDRVQVLYIEARRHQLLAARYGIRAIPTELIFSADGAEEYRHAGFVESKDVIALLSDLVKAPAPAQTGKD